MRKIIHKVTLIIFGVIGMVVFFSPQAKAQFPEEISERKLSSSYMAENERKLSASYIAEFEKEVIQKKKKIPRRLFSSFELSSGYETNALLGATRKGDISYGARYSMNYNRLFGTKTRISASYDIDGTEYNEFTDLSNLLNHMRFTYERALNKKVGVGIGYDFSYLYYRLSRESNYLFHKNFVFLRHKWTPKISHQLLLEYGIKNYTEAKAYLNNTRSFQDDKRRDDRELIEYGWNAGLTKKLFLRLRGRFSINDSNALFQDYYDYKSYDVSPRISYRLTPKNMLNCSFMKTFRDYEARLVAGQRYEREDTLWNTSAGITHAFNKDNSLTLNYTHSRATSNDPTAEYTGSGVTSAWQYNF